MSIHYSAVAYWPVSGGSNVISSGVVFVILLVDFEASSPYLMVDPSGNEGVDKRQPERE